ncbi:hypothetical protein GRI34_09715 [Erythrobacter aquimaris]|uniref:Pectate lyase superfamily protein domain-containing protein n=1 Tax=Qipengyuania aquimaris TaxID=255984 RepID=A0A6I4TNC2_9SPHN|nr:hypothetical protein [Qipengyuania aquimaris]MXO96690.1 hypothetical protein [Qipengyuania aquimaris]
MSALSMVPLGLANRASQCLPGLFTDLEKRSVPLDVDRVETSGYAEAGKGAATYISDDLCTPAFHSIHPACTARTFNGRIFRILPASAEIAVEQAGALGDGTTNDQQAIQAALDYAAAVEAATVAFYSSRYRIDCPLRVSPATETRAEDGHPLVVRRSVALKGKAADRSVLEFRGLDGEDPETGWQLVPTASDDPALAVWRGGGLFLQGDVEDPVSGEKTIGRLELDRLVLEGGRHHTRAYAWPADILTGDGWDITDKALWVQDCFVGEIVCTDTDMIGWKGEIFYLGGALDMADKVVLERCRFATTNGSAFNPGCNVDIVASDCSFGDCFQAQEDVGKSRAIYRNCIWHDCDHMGLGSGATDTLEHNFLWPTRDDQLPPPLTRLDQCEFRNIGWLRFFSWVGGSIRAVDSPIGLPGWAGQALRDVDLDIEAVLDRKQSIHALTIDGVASLTEQVSGAPAGTYQLPPANLAITLKQRRTREAQFAQRQWLGVLWNGYIDHSCAIHAEGEFASGRVPNGGDTPLSMPLVTMAKETASSSYWARGWYRPATFSGSGEILVTAPLMSIGLESAIIADMTLARTPLGGAQHGYADGQRIRITKDGATGTLRFEKGASPAFAVRATRNLADAYDWIEFVYNRELQRWEENGFFSAA